MAVQEKYATLFSRLVSGCGRSCPGVNATCRDIACITIRFSEGWMRYYLGLLLLVAIALYTMLGQWSVGVPVRAAVLALMLALVVLCYPSVLGELIRTFRGTFLLISTVGLIGCFVSAINDRSAADIYEYLSRNTLQPILIVACTYVVCRTSGPKLAAALFIGFALLTGAVASAQYLGLGAAWDLRDSLGNIQDEAEGVRRYLEARTRPLGLSLTPIVYSYHIASAYVVANLLRRRGLIGGRLYATVVGLLVISALANETRSLLVAIVVTEVLQNLVGLRMRNVILGLGVLSVSYAALSLLQSAGSRLGSVQDESAQGRITLLRYGLRLASDYPLGLGWGFDPGELAWLYWSEFSSGVNAEALFRLDLHNAFLNFFLIYGVLGAIAVLIAAMVSPRYFFGFCWSFSGYFIHCLVHNNGVFLGDYFFWFACGVYFGLHEEQEERERDSVLYRTPATPIPHAN